ncbi:MAG TPA: hypothetical protein VEY68_02395 [Anoxybacillus sp.]|nr:hypothetical protein [Anoxybacillus sp.]
MENTINHFGKKLVILLMSLIVVFLFGLAKANAAQVNTMSQKDKELSNLEVEVEMSDEWMKGNSKEKKEEEKFNRKPKLIHNNGKPLKQDVLEDPGENHLIAIYQAELNGKLYEKYYFSNMVNNNIDEIKNDVIENTKMIKTDPNGFIKKLSKTEKGKEESLDLISIAAVQPELSGGHWRTYSWSFYSPITSLKAGTFTTSLHFDRKSSSANINGKTGSIWDIRAFNEYEASNYRIDIQNTRMDVNYSAQQIHSYGPFDDAGFDVSVNLTGFVSGNAWSFNVGSVYTNNDSSIANKYGRWEWYHTWGYMQDPFVTQPGMRVSNTSGNLAIKHSHSFHTSYSYWHYTGVVTTYIPDR